MRSVLNSPRFLCPYKEGEDNLSNWPNWGWRTPCQSIMFRTVKETNKPTESKNMRTLAAPKILNENPAAQVAALRWMEAKMSLEEATINLKSHAEEGVYIPYGEIAPDGKRAGVLCYGSNRVSDLDTIKVGVLTDGKVDSFELYKTVPDTGLFRAAAKLYPRLANALKRRETRTVSIKAVRI